MRQPKYLHSTWGLYVKDAETGEVIHDLNSDQMFLPASTTKLFSVAALLHAYGDDFRFKTPVFALGSVEKEVLYGNLILVAQGDLTFGGRQDNRSDSIAFTDLDHTIANNVPGVTLTKQNPLNALNALAKQIKDKGIKEIDGDVLIDDRLFQIDQKRDTVLSPIMINENLIDIVLNPSEVDKNAELMWRPQVPGYNVSNEVKTVSKDQPMRIEVSADALGRNILVRGTIPIGQKDVVRTFSITDPNHFARSAFIQALQNQGIAVRIKASKLPAQNAFHGVLPIAVWISPPLSEYAKLILKVSHNLGANLIPLLLAVRNGQKTFAEGMQDLGKFVMDEVKLPRDAFVFIDGAGGDENRLTPQAELHLLQYMIKCPAGQFRAFFDALPIMGVDGSLADFAKGTAAAGKVRAKTGTGVSFNIAANQFFLTTQALAGYIEGRNGHLLEFMVVVNNGSMPAIVDIFPIFEDQSQIAAFIYDSVK